MRKWVLGGCLCAASTSNNPCDEAVAAAKVIDVHAAQKHLAVARQHDLPCVAESDPKSTYDCKHQAEGERDCLKEWAEGWAFAAAALPQIAKCDADAAEVVRKNLEVPSAGGKAGYQVPDGYMKVKEAVEGTYECLGITCEQVGVFDAANSGMEACTDTGGGGGGDSGGGDSGGGGGGGDNSSDAALGLRASLLAALAALAAYAL